MSHASGGRNRLGWLAAEFLVVVLGVVVGLAVDSWRDTRTDLDREIGYLERLRDDLESDTAMLARVQVQDSLRGGMVLSYLDIVDGAVPFPDDHITALEGLTASLMASFNLPRRDTYDELINQADLRRIRSRAVREGLAEYHGTAGMAAAAQFEEWKETAARVESLLVERLEPDLYRWVQTASSPAIIADRSMPHFEPSAKHVRSLVENVRRDAEIRNLLYRQSQVQIRLSRVHRDWLASARALIETLDDELGRLEN
jgi:hypothetical protein